LIRVNSKEYQCWHELGHAFTCLHYGGDVEFVEFVNDPKSKGIARARCSTNTTIRQYVACGGFAAEFYLLRSGNLGNLNEQWIAQEVFKNATIDRELYFNKLPGSNFTKEEDTEFMNLAVQYVKPILERYQSELNVAVQELLRNDRIEGHRLKEIIGITSVTNHCNLHTDNKTSSIDLWGKFKKFLKNKFSR